MKRPTEKRKRLNGAHSRTAATAPKRKASIARAHLEIAVLVGTRKCALIYYGDSSRRRWRVDGPHFLGHIIDHIVLDPRDHRTLLAAARSRAARRPPRSISPGVAGATVTGLP